MRLSRPAKPQAARSRRCSVNPLIVFSLTIFTSATLLFFVEPMVGKMILPRFGGTPAVWNTCMLWFQAMLLLGYTYAHALTAHLSLRGQRFVHGLVVLSPLVAFALFPLGVYEGYEPRAESYLMDVLVILTLMVGLPFFIVSTSAPLLQKWFSATGHPAAKDPYFLYAASNLGSMVALLLYPVLVEPRMRLVGQGIFWMIGYGALAALTIACARQVRLVPQPALADVGVPGPAVVLAPSSEKIKEPPDLEKPSGAPVEVTSPEPAPAKARRWHKNKSAVEKLSEQTDDVPEPSPLATEPTLATRLRWIMLGFVPSSLMLGLTTYLTTDIAAIPLLWIIPLTIYLVSFILVFSSLDAGVRNWSRKQKEQAKASLLPFLHRGIGNTLSNGVHGLMVMWMPVVLLLLIFIVVTDIYVPTTLKFCIHLLNLFLIAMVCHGELARSRPGTDYLTGFFLCMSIGGVLGGLFNAILAPLAFNSIAEYHLVIVIACLMLPPGKPEEQNLSNLIVDVVLAAGLGFATLFVSWKWLNIHWGGGSTPDWNEVGKALWSALSPPGLKPGLIHILFVVGSVLASLLYVFIPRRSDQKPIQSADRAPLWMLFALAVFLGGGLPGLFGLLAYLAWERRGWEVRLLDVLEGIAFCLLTALLIQPESFGITSPLQGWGPLDHVMESLQQRFNAERGQVLTVFACGLMVLLCFAFSRQPIRFGLCVGAVLLAKAYLIEDGAILHQERSFFGVLRVEQTRSGSYHRLMHGTTLHGMQNMRERVPTLPPLLAPLLAGNPVEVAASTIAGRDAALANRTQPLTYFHRTGPIGIVFQSLFANQSPPGDVAIIGLGTGTLASYARLGQNVTFYEIDPVVIRIAGNPDWFTYLTDCLGNVRFDVGDARLRLRHADEKKYRLLVVDAFSSDAIPVHLITKEAVELYMQKLADDGILAIHISNRHLKLGPVLGNIAQSLGLTAYRMQDDNTDLGGETIVTKNPSDWVVLAKKPEHLEGLRWFDRCTNLRLLPHQELKRQPEKVDPRYYLFPDRLYTELWQIDMLSTMLGANQMHLLIDDERWKPLETAPNQAVWTDDFSNILSIFRW